jgi:D-alanyl-D-alanine carboxypeptidase
MSHSYKPLFKYLALALAVLACAPSTSRAVDATAYIIMDSTTGHVLGGNNANKRVQVGSLTKIATAMVVLDWAGLNKRDLNEMVTVPTAASVVAGMNPIGLQTGDQISLRDLLYAALMQSDNAAAYTLADHVGQHLEAGQSNVTPADRFVAHMNALARKLDMKNTLFLNPHGLEHLENKLPYSSASDLARLSAYAMSNSAFRFFVSQKERSIRILHTPTDIAQYLLKNTNELLGTNGIDGVKTGRTQRAGECVVISSVRAPESRQEGQTYIVTPRRLLVVVLGSTERFTAATQLLDTGWQLYDQWAAQGRPLKKGEGL